MKKSIRKILSLTLVLAMALTMGTIAFADDIPDATGPVFNTVFNPTGGNSGATSYVSDRTQDHRVEFNGGNEDEGALDVPASELDAEGDYAIIVARGDIIPQEEIPGTNTSDNYYRQLGWVLESDYNNGDFDRLVDLDTYVVNGSVKFIAVYEDTWPPYDDMAQDRSDWYYTYVRDLSIQGVVNGMPNGDFEPGGNLKYGEALKLIMLATGYEEQPQVGNHWADGYYAKALEDGLVIDTDINLDDPITRAEVAEIVFKALKLADPTIENPFADTELAAAISLFEVGIMEGSFDSQDVDQLRRLFKPDDFIIRSEISAIIWRIAEYYNSLQAA